MPIQIQLANGSSVGGGGAAFLAANVHEKPLDYKSDTVTFGHYRVVSSPVLLPAQAANSRLFELRNSGTALIVPTLVEVEALSTGDVANEGLLWISMFGCTNFTGVDTTNVSTPAAMVVRPTGMSAAPGGAQVRMCNGHVSGMTGGTLTKDSGAHSDLIAYMGSASPDRPQRIKRFVDPADRASHLPVYAANQGFLIQNTFTGSADANSIMLIITVAWAEVAVY